MTKYRKSRQSYPDDVLLITDSGKNHVDRYTAYYKPYKGTFIFPYVGMSENPFHPQGFGQHCELNHRYTIWGTKDRVIEFEQLPTECQQFVMTASVV